MKDSIRAYLNYWDLNRIEMDTEYLADLLNGYGYNQNITHKTDWLMGRFSVFGRDGKSKNKCS